MIEVKIIEKSPLTETICCLRLAATNGSTLTTANPGSHIDVQLPNGLIRQYSICSELSANIYEIAVLKEPKGRGASLFIHQSLNVGDTLLISEPKNLFPLAPTATKSLLIAAGVGITPILSMAEHLLANGADFSLHYCAKSPEKMAYKQRIASSSLAANTQLYFSQTQKRMNLAEVISAPQADLHLYVCGPAAFNDEVINCANALGWQANNIHREYFTATPIDHSNDGSFEIEINSTGDIFSVAADQSILNVLEDQGFFIPVACEEGVCGTCITGLLSGEAEHKDVFMTDDEHARMDRITPCCSRAKSTRLKLDL